MRWRSFFRFLRSAFFAFFSEPSNKHRACFYVHACVSTLDYRNNTAAPTRCIIVSSIPWIFQIVWRIIFWIAHTSSTRWSIFFWRFARRITTLLAIFPNVWDTRAPTKTRGCAGSHTMRISTFSFILFRYPELCGRSLNEFWLTSSCLYIWPSLMNQFSVHLPLGQLWKNFLLRAFNGRVIHSFFHLHNSVQGSHYESQYLFLNIVFLVAQLGFGRKAMLSLPRRFVKITNVFQWGFDRPFSLHMRSFRRRRCAQHFQQKQLQHHASNRRSWLAMPIDITTIIGLGLRLCRQSFTKCLETAKGTSGTTATTRRTLPIVKFQGGCFLGPFVAIILVPDICLTFSSIFLWLVPYL